MKLFVNEAGHAALSLSCPELARIPLMSDEKVFDASFSHGGIDVTLFSALPEVEDAEGLPALAIPYVGEKFTRRDVAAAMAYVFCSSQGLDAVGLKLSEEHVQKVTRAEAFGAVQRALDKLYDILHLTPDAILYRAEKLSTLRFPYTSLRAGQKALMRESYAAMCEKRDLFASAPTGIGKTLSVLYPALKALSHAHAAKIFYLTPRGSLQPQVAEALQKLQGEETYLHTITLWAKGRICEEGMKCVHTTCPRRRPEPEKEARALKRLFETYGHITPEAIRLIANEEGVCPFELSLSASLYCEVILCDYNYIFDPHAALKRYQAREENYILLCDEAHNLVSRVRESFSAELSPKMLAPFSTGLFSKHPEICEAAKRLSEALNDNRPNPNEAWDPISFLPPEGLALPAAELCEALCPLTQKKSGKDFSAELITTAKDLYFALRNFLEAHADFDRHRALCTYEDGGVKILLVDPGDKVRAITRDLGCCIFFSATLSPRDYYLGMLGGDKDAYLDLPSPFDPAHLKLLTCPISTFYKDRERTALFAARLIAASVKPRCGNYMAFFPSFEYLNRVAAVYRTLCPHDAVLCQRPQMTEHERAEYLAAFSEKRSENLIGFAVLGGLFSEGVDLVGEKLVGEILFGVGMPPPSPEAEAVRRRFDDIGEDGTALGYTYPGFNRVLQSAGRVIRTATDRGFLFLCDERYLSEGFEGLFPSYWDKPTAVEDPGEAERLIRAFWEEEALS